MQIAEETARNPRTADAETRGALSPLRLMVDGLGMEERASLEAILGILSGKLRRDWIHVGAADTAIDLYLHASGQRRPDVRAGLTGLVVREDEKRPSADVLALVSPFRVMSVLELLESAADRLVMQMIPGGPVDGGDAIVDHQEVNDEKSVAASLARSLAGPNEHTLRVRILGYGTLYVCTRSRIYCMDFERSQIMAALEAKRFVLMAISPDSAEFQAARTSALPIERLLWPIGLMVPHDQLTVAQRYRLRAWPDFANIPHQPVHLQACAQLSGVAMTMGDLAKGTGMSLAQADRFLHACDLCGLLERIRDKSPAASVTPPPATPSTQAVGGLFDRLWRRLIRQGE